MSTPINSPAFDVSGFPEYEQPHLNDDSQWMRPYLFIESKLKRHEQTPTRRLLAKRRVTLDFRTAIAA
ncbi:hypothetical protein F2Q69_00033255 [Brassica cretica]|uniref:Uncharacterized protein n=1 Tax=Brassica cretica TaxID=69181 RepID=A0A8S9SBS3_BRACR|nr:hypothetical protein F2Q69_00033255 [Brassica cretica]